MASGRRDQPAGSQKACPLPEGAFVAATYVLLVLIASRFYLAAADRLAQAT